MSEAGPSRTASRGPRALHAVPDPDVPPDVQPPAAPAAQPVVEPQPEAPALSPPPAVVPPAVAPSVVVASPAVASPAVVAPAVVALSVAAARPGLRFTGTSLSILAVLLLGFVAEVTLLGSLAHDRAQKVAYADLRAALAQATAPVGHTDADGAPLAPGTAVAVLTIPRIGLREVVAEGTDSAVLTGGPGHRRDTVLPGQAGVSVVLGRRAAYGGPFARIGELRGGDSITVVTGQGEHTYQVIGVRRAGEPQPPDLAPEAGRLTLVTADGAAYLPADVLRVDAAQTSPVQVTPRLAISPAALPRDEQPMGFSLMALVPLVLWAQLLVGATLGVVWIRQRVSPWHAWLIGLPVLTLLGVLVADQGVRLLPNLL